MVRVKVRESIVRAGFVEHEGKDAHEPVGTRFRKETGRVPRGVTPSSFCRRRRRRLRRSHSRYQVGRRRASNLERGVEGTARSGSRSKALSGYPARNSVGDSKE